MRVLAGFGRFWPFLAIFWTKNFSKCGKGPIIKGPKEPSTKVGFLGKRPLARTGYHEAADLGR